MIGTKKFVVATLNLDDEAFIIHIAAFNISPDNKIHPSKKAQIVDLKTDEARTKVHNKYINFKDVFLPKLAGKLANHMDINNHAIMLANN